MTLAELLDLLARTLDAHDIPYMLTGSLASSFHGVPRATQDIDVVVDATAGALLEAGEALRDAGLYVSDEAIGEAVASGGIFNAVDPGSGWKVDFVMRKDRPFSRSEFESRRSIDFMGVHIGIARAEDMVVAKLEWAKLGDSERQIRDVAELLRVQGRALDQERIERWVGELGLSEEWERARRLAERGG